MSRSEEANNSLESNIIDDELIRFKVRRFVEAQAESEFSFWKFINSAFVLWLLSSVALSFGTYLFSSYQDSQKQAAVRALRIDSLRQEISYRLDPASIEFLFGSDGSNKESPGLSHVLNLCFSPDNLADTSRSVVFPSAPVSSGSDPEAILIESEIRKQLLASRFIQPEFRDRSVYSLVWELERIETDATQIDLLKKAINSLNKLRLDALANQKTQPARAYLTPVSTLIDSWR